MTIWIKQGVTGDLMPIVQKALGRVAELYKNNKRSTYITSIREGNHMSGSFHYIGMAFDIACQGISKIEIQSVVGPGFQVIEYKILDIFHVEYDSQ